MYNTEQKKLIIDLFSNNKDKSFTANELIYYFDGKINKATEVAQDGISKISDVKFFHGQAFSKADGKAFSGIISDKLKNGDTIEMIYKDGVLQKSKRKGTKNILKTFEYLDNNTTLKRVNTSKPGKVREAVYHYYSNNSYN